MIVDDIESADLLQFPPFTALLVRTVHSVYRVVITRGPEVYVQGGDFFPNPTAAYVEGAGTSEESTNVGWIRVGRAMQIRTRGRLVITSPVRAITAEQASGSLVH